MPRFRSELRPHTLVASAFVLLLLCGLCSGFNPLFGYDTSYGPKDGGSFAELHLPTDQDGMIFRPKVPIPMYGKAIEQLTIFKNGLIGLDDLSVGNLRTDYPKNTLSTGERLQHLDGRYLSVFSTVNDGQSGTIAVRESDAKNVSAIGCANAKQVGRLQRLIHLSYPTDRRFEATSVLSIMWSNMTNRAEGIHKTNSYTVIIVSNGVSSYATFQYWNIQWPELDKVVSNALAPEAGIFMRPLGGYQLPRSGHSVQTSLWMTESNVAVPGEWLIPLSDVSLTSGSLFDLLPKILAEFIQDVQTDCAQDPKPQVRLHEEVLIRRVPKTGNHTDLLNDSPTPPAADYSTESMRWVGSENTDGWKDDEEEEEDYTDSEFEALESDLWNTGDRKESGTSNMISSVPVTAEYHDPMMPIRPETEFPLGVYDGDENRSYTIEPPVIPETYIPLEDERISETSPDVQNYSTLRTDTWSSQPELRVFHTERCDTSAKCASAESDCYRVDGQTCCVCREGFYGSGNHHCWREDVDYKFAFNGTMTANLGAPDMKRFVAYLDIQHGLVKRSSSGIRQADATDPIYQTLRLLTPVFHILNSIVASSCADSTADSDANQREFNIFTLGGAFRSTFAIQFLFKIEHVGQLSVRALLKLKDDTSRSFSTGKIDIEVTAAGPVTLVDRAYHEAYGVGSSDGKSYYTSYHVDHYGRIVFPEQSVKFVAQERSAHDQGSEKDELMVRWSGIAEMLPAVGEDPSSGCLLQSDTIVPREKHHYIRLRDRGYCSEDCSSPEGFCNLFCVDEPILFAYEPNSCDCVHCEQDGEVCMPEGAGYSCSCRPGLRRMEDRTCRDVPGQKEPCGQVMCHSNARCINPAQGFCQCLPGFRGDGVERCDRDPCAQCRRNEVCVNDVCTPSGVDLCEGVRCGENAFCQDGACICTPGYTGDPMIRCLEERDLCAGVQCHPFGQCYENRCYCKHGYTGDGVNFCDSVSDDPCQGVQCAAYARCHSGRCSCDPGYEGDGYNECRPAIDKCANIQCQPYAQCYDGYCRCMDGYEDDGNQKCRPKMTGPCVDSQCPPNTHCVNNRCQCKEGFEDDGYGCREISVPSQCDNCRGIPFKELAQCVYGRCVCAPGFFEVQPGLCVECVQENCHPKAQCLPNPQYNKAYSCQCKRGFTGDGIRECQPSVPSEPDVDRPCTGPEGCPVRNAECNRVTGRCECRPGYEGDGNHMCQWNCRLCLPDADCDQQNERCSCKPGFYGDGQTYCERIPTTPEPIQVQITGQGDTYRIADLSRQLELRCYVTTRDETVTGQWIQPNSSQHAEIVITRLSNGTELLLRISRPAMMDVGRYYCRAGKAEAYIDVAIDETALPYDIFLTSDDGILKVRSSGINSSVATLWNIAENNKYGRVALVADCNSQRIIYTSDYGHSIRWGEAHVQQKSLTTTQLYSSDRHRFRNLAIDPPSGNVFAWDEAFSKIVVLNPSKPHMQYTLNAIGSLQQPTPIRLAGLAVHPEQGLLYWASFTDGWMPNGTIQVADMTGENEGQLIQLNGEPLALSISPSTESSGSSAGRLCWIQRSITNVFALATELYCARLSPDGRQVIIQERLRQFSPTEEPSWGMVHHRGTVLWTDATRTVYYSANPAKRVHVRHVCCSNRFQAIAALAPCHPSTKNACTFSNGRCRYFCLPSGNKHSRVCVCPDNEPGCHREI
ncbi:Tenascin [Fasciola gigantica]|uniref:Tenascin n=1 Tax=Fasciola gigantica TaxID=46835 RepID=A0A504YL70_FASGI|nr:Tenascin [Fasciola gigantica]